MITDNSAYISNMAGWCKIKCPILLAEDYTDEDIVKHCIDKAEFQGMLNTCSAVMVRSVKNATKEFFDRLVGNAVAETESINSRWCICVGLSMREWKALFRTAIDEYQPDTFHEEIYNELGEMCKVLYKDFPIVFEREYHKFYPEIEANENVE